uniref:Uncharacterized protein n=1 Tax=Anguilla anguilla TaxID=7936 RepID=A0A0E9QBH1_ANGAN
MPINLLVPTSTKQAPKSSPQVCVLMLFLMATNNPTEQ